MQWCHHDVTGRCDSLSEEDTEGERLVKSLEEARNGTVYVPLHSKETAGKEA